MCSRRAAGEAGEDHIAEADIATGDSNLAGTSALIADADAVFRQKAADDQISGGEVAVIVRELHVVIKKLRCAIDELFVEHDAGDQSGKDRA